MDFSEVYKQSHMLCKFSPNGKYIAVVVQFRVVVRDTETMQILHLFTCTDHLQQIAWSKDSDLIACASYRLGAIQVWRLSDPTWSARIDEGVAGLTNVLFAPDSRSLLTFSEYQVCNMYFFISALPKPNLNKLP